MRRLLNLVLAIFSSSFLALAALPVSAWQEDVADLTPVDSAPSTPVAPEVDAPGEPAEVLLPPSTEQEDVGPITEAKLPPREFFGATPPPAAISIEDQPGDIEEIEAVDQSQQVEPGALPADVTQHAEATRDQIDIRAMVFKEVEPGVTKTEDVIAAWGEPTERTPRQWAYEIKPFKRVDVMLSGARVESLVIHLSRPVAPHTVAGQLGLEAFRPIDVNNEAGNTLGHAYAERGVTFGFAVGKDEPLVAQILLEPITADTFILRLLQTEDQHLQRKLQDTALAIAINPTDARAWYLRADLLYQSGDYQQATDCIDAALGLDADSPRFTLLQSKLLAKQGHYDRAIKQTTEVVKDSATSKIVRAQGAAQLGDLIAASPKRQHNTALKHHQGAIKFAVELAADERQAVRRQAKRILIESHLGVASDIAQGNWQKKDATVPQWIDRARVLVEDYRENEQDDLHLEFQLACRSLQAYAAFESENDPAAISAQAEHYARQLIADSTDTDYRKVIDRQLARALVDAVEAQRRRGNAASALEIADKAKKTLKRFQPTDNGDAEGHMLISRLYFLVGSIHAVQRKDHGAAVNEFEEAVEAISQPDIDYDLGNLQVRGEWLVSMAVSYWETDEKQKAVQLTELGAKFLQRSVDAGVAKQESLTVPYSNLSFMHGELGEAEAAEKYVNLAEKVRASQQR